MKLVAYVIGHSELQDYLDKYQEKIKFLLPYAPNGWKITVVIDEE